MKSPRIAIVVAVSKEKRAIGKNGKLLWHISEDLKRFKAITTGHPVIMGRKTFESIVEYLGKPLPGRTNIVVTRNEDYQHDGATVTRSLEEALQKAGAVENEEIHIGGGAEMYALALPYVSRLYLTVVHDEPDADTFFPEYGAFTKIIERSEHTTNDGLRYDWITLERP